MLERKTTIDVNDVLNTRRNWYVNGNFNNFLSVESHN